MSNEEKDTVIYSPLLQMANIQLKVSVLQNKRALLSMYLCPSVQSHEEKVIGEAAEILRSPLTGGASVVKPPHTHLT